MLSIKNILLVFVMLILNFQSAHSEAKIRYIDVDFVVNNSLVGKSLISQLNKLNKKDKDLFLNIEAKLTKTEKEIISQKNVITKEDYQNRIKDFNNQLRKFKDDVRLAGNNLNIKKNNAQIKIFDQVTVLLEEYVKKNSITLLISKKSVVIGVSKNDITNDIVDILNKKIKKINIE